MVFIMACWGEIGWCLPKWKEQEIKLWKVLNDLKNKAKTPHLWAVLRSKKQ